ncbi:respiratory nitrate reductase subunit gamma [Paraburkholderia phymatum]|uniref:nitrate reductase (quinone) n=1 Tax=Paraburkholderia phymatum (strain DSM 17167 / CIP 108236 / LMG 21445 / STM815) TaxID=391038 RepID=B2JWA7_PARP8|nr:respiratory nitrate reductase subunit gamma [Paraburkholderia phymatum]ACC75234.1 respiratory nitrate reductase, gamma subunit [Paraburkholderia phymatum STM815]
MNLALHTFLFSVYPYLCLAVFLIGSLVRFDRDQYTWKSDSSQLLRASQLRWGSNLFHIGILFLLLGHSVGLLTPHFAYAPFISAQHKQMLAIVSGGVAGSICFVGLTLLLHRRITDPRIRATSRRSDMAVLIILWLQLCLGLASLPWSFADRGDAATMLTLADWAQHLLTMRPEPSALLAVPVVFKLHLVLGMTLFVLFPFTRLVHIWSGFASLAYMWRPYQLVRSRRLHGPRRAARARREI